MRKQIKLSTMEIIIELTPAIGAVQPLDSLYVCLGAKIILRHT